MDIKLRYLLIGTFGAYMYWLSLHIHEQHIGIKGAAAIVALLGLTVLLVVVLSHHSEVAFVLSVCAVALVAMLCLGVFMLTPSLLATSGLLLVALVLLLAAGFHDSLWDKWYSRFYGLYDQTPAPTGFVETDPADPALVRDFEDDESPLSLDEQLLSSPRDPLG